MYIKNSLLRWRAGDSVAGKGGAFAGVSMFHSHVIISVHHDIIEYPFRLDVHYILCPVYYYLGPLFYINGCNYSHHLLNHLLWIQASQQTHLDQLLQVEGMPCTHLLYQHPL